MSDTTITMPVHPVTGERALGIGKRGPIWPQLGGSGEGGEGGNDGGTGGTETGVGDGGEGDQKSETDWKAMARHWERQSKANAVAATELQQLKDAQKSESEKAADKLKAAEAEIAGVPAKVAESLRAHLVKLHKISDEDAELFLTATDPELLLKQVNRLVGGLDRSKKNIVSREGRTSQRPSDDPERTAVRQLFSS